MGAVIYLPGVDTEVFCDACLAGMNSSEHVGRCLRRWTCPECHLTDDPWTPDGERVPDWEMALLHHQTCREASH